MISSVSGSFDLPRLVLGHAPTLLDLAPKPDELWGGPLLFKREDRIDELGCGNKLRRLEYAIADAIECGADVLVTYGSQRSNQTKALAVCAARSGLDCHLLFGGDIQQRPMTAQGNYLVTKLSRVQVQWFENTPWNQMEALARSYASNLQEQGRRPYLIPSGVGIWPGILGTYDMAIELRQQLLERGIQRAAVIMPVGSASTVCGVQLANLLHGYDWELVGICVSAAKEVGIEGCKRLVGTIPPGIVPIDLTGEEFAASIIWYDEVPNRGYDTFAPEELNAMRRLFQASGIIFEPNYMLKCCQALPQLRRSGILNQELPCVLIHTGGHFSIFDMPESSREFLKDLR
jgi:1-aminocyclopropane-1-carboxylate deaminase/D-cysteine desulfhydrase-like pyridoxal-dependent ACC family enzyme